MRGIILFMLLVMVFGCAQPEPPAEEPAVVNETDITNETNVTECSGPVCGSDGVTYDTDCDVPEGIDFTAGACVQEFECTDSDGGIESKVAGEVQFDQTYEDHCVDEKQLIEYACIENEVANATIECEHGCEGGRCAEEPEPDLNCYGPVEVDIMVAESVTQNNTLYMDTCIDYTTVKDYYCKDNAVKAQNSQCPSGYRCNLGACEELTTTCEETDLGPDTSERGRTQVSVGFSISFNEWDECVDEGKVLEHYCTIDGAVSEEIECGSGFKCSSGKCIPSECSETDDGYDIYKKGVTTSGDYEERDDCINDYKLREYYCYGDDIESDDHQCPEGYICDGDRCTEGSIS